MTPAFLETRAVTKRRDGRAVVDAVSLVVRAGESVVILGPSGSGKTSLLRIIAGLDVPDEGEVWLEGRRVSAPRQIVVPAHERHLGFVFQDLALWPHMTIHQHLDFVLKARAVPASERLARVRDALIRARIDQMADRFPHQLSGGEQQRAALARAIVTRPRLLLLDEPLSNLDPDLRSELRRELVRIKHNLDLTLLHVTHDREEAAELADRVVRIRFGCLQPLAAEEK
jgi:ABC-type Fe3+/spermidine/putrescine transport system ATPase subunit